MGLGGQSYYSSTFLKLLAGQMRDVVEAFLWNELTKLVGESGEAYADEQDILRQNSEKRRQEGTGFKFLRSKSSYPNIG